MLWKIILKTNLKLRLPNTKLMKKNKERIYKAFEKECIDLDDLDLENKCNKCD